MNAEALVDVLLEARSRFFVQLDANDRKRAEIHSVQSHRHRILDRETVLDGRYKVIADKLSYYDAQKAASLMNADPDRAEEIASMIEREKVPVHNLGSERFPDHRTF